MLRVSKWFILIGSLVVSGFASGQEAPDKQVISGTGAAETVSAEGFAFFEKKIRPVLVAECYGCHSSEKGKKIRGGLVVDTREGIRKGGESGPVIVPGSPSRSLLVKALGHSDPKLAMPPKKKLDMAIIHDFEEWIRMGSPDPRQG